MKKKKNIVQTINQSVSFEEAKENILLLAEAAGMRDTMTNIFKNANTNYEIGMAVSKVFDFFALTPTMNWLPNEIKAMYKDFRALCKEIGNFFGDYFEENNQLCIDNGENIFRYDTERELLADWVETLVYNHYDCKENGNVADSWEKEIRFIYEDVIGEYPTGVRLYRGKKKNRYIAESYVSNGVSHGKMIYLGTFDSIVDAICAVWKHKGILS